MRTFLLAIIAIFLLTAVDLLVPTTTNAVDFSLGVYPPIIQIQADAPSVITKDLTLVNASDSQMSVALQLRMFTQTTDNNGQVSYSTNQPYPDRALFQKVQLLDNGNPIGGITLAPKQKKTLTLRIALPQGEQPADYYFSLLFLSNAPVASTTNGSQINAGIAANVLLSIGPKGPTTGFLNEFSAPHLVQTGPIPFTVSVNNTSDHYITPTGQIIIHNMFGQLIGKVALLPVNILQHSSRYIPSKGEEHAAHPVVLWNEKVLFGLYQARLSIALSREGPLFTKTIYFFAMPISYLIGFIVTIFLVVIIILRVREKMHEA